MKCFFYCKHCSLSKNQSDNSSFDLRESLLRLQYSCHATQKLENSNVLYYNKKNLVELKHWGTRISYRVFYLIYLILEYDYVTWKPRILHCVSEPVSSQWNATKVDQTCKLHAGTHCSNLRLNSNHCTFNQFQKYHYFCTASWVLVMKSLKRSDVLLGSDTSLWSMFWLANLKFVSAEVGFWTNGRSWLYRRLKCQLKRIFRWSKLSVSH